MPPEDPEDGVSFLAMRLTRCLFRGEVKKMLAGRSIRADPG